MHYIHINLLSDFLQILYIVQGSILPRINIFLSINYFIQILYCRNKDLILEINLIRK
jgi:hypothetical protein